MIVQDRLWAFVEGDRSCLAPLPTANLDPHTWCIKCRGVKCLPSNQCNACAKWSEEQWLVYFATHKSSHTAKIVRKVKNFLQSESSKRRLTTPFKEASIPILPPEKRGRREECATVTLSKSQARLGTPPKGSVSLAGHAPLAPSSSRPCAGSLLEEVACGSPSTLPGSSPLGHDKVGKSQVVDKHRTKGSRVINGALAMPVEKGSLDSTRPISSSKLLAGTDSSLSKRIFTSPTTTRRV